MKFKEFKILEKYSVSSISNEAIAAVYHKRILSEADFWQIVNAIRSRQPLFLYNTNIRIEDYAIKNVEVSSTIDNKFPDFYGEFIFNNYEYMIENRSYFQNFKITESTSYGNLGFTYTISPKIEISLRPENLDFIPFGGTKAGKVLYGKT